jgi:hypothetical protein
MSQSRGVAWAAREARVHMRRPTDKNVGTLRWVMFAAEASARGSNQVYQKGKRNYEAEYKNLQCCRFTRLHVDGGVDG